MEQDSNELVVAAPRRRLLRGAGAALVGAAGVAVAGSPASAAPGDAVVIGQVNDSAATSTTLTNSSADPALVLTNPSGPALRLLPTPFDAFPADDEWDWGTIFVDPLGDLGVVAAVGFQAQEGGPIEYAKVPSAVYSSLWATTPVTVRPTRVLDTRDAALLGNIVSGAENIDSSGRVMAGKTIVLSFDNYVDLGSAVHVNVTVANTAGGGFLTLWGTGNRPNASSLNWWRNGQILSNAVLSPLGERDGHQSAIAIYCSQTTSVIVDLNGFDVAGPWQVHADLPTGTPTAVTQQVKQARGKMPAYRRPGNRALLV